MLLSRLARRSLSGLSSRQATLAARCIQRHTAVGFNAAAPPSTTPTRWSSSGSEAERASPVKVETVSVGEDDSRIRIERTKADQTTERRTFNNLWLRDNCQCSACVNPDTRQRNFDTFELGDVQPKEFFNHETHLEVLCMHDHDNGGGSFILLIVGRE
jgi:hypothetical protein